MFHFSLLSVRIRRLAALAAACALCTTAVGANKVASKVANRGPITTLTLNADAPVVDAFAAMESGKIKVRMAMSNANEGQIYFTNKTDGPLTVALPKALVGVHVLPQQGFMGMGMVGNQMGGGMNGGMNGGGMAQMVGGNAMQGMGQNAFPQGNQQMNNNLPGNNFFSIPPERTVQINLQSVCLNYGRPDPHLGLTYRLVKVESVTTDPVLQQLLEDYSPRTNRDAQQAAAWHLANGLSWEQLAHVGTEPTPGIHVPLFNNAQLEGARQLVEQAKTKAAERPAKTAPPVVTAAVR